MTSPSLDSTFGSVALTTYSSATATASSTAKAGGTNRVFCAIIAYELDQSGGANRTVSSITESSSTLTFTKNFSIKNTTGSNTSGAYGETIEVWTATDSSGTFNSGGANLTWTLTMSGIADNVAATVFAVSGCASSFLDGNSGIPFTAFNSTNTTPPVVTYSTTNADDLLIFCSATSGAATPGTPSGWSAATGLVTEISGTQYERLQASYRSVSAAQTNQTVQDPSASSQTGWTALMFAFTADAASVSGTWASTEGTDTMSMHGGVLGGHWSSTDTQDTFHAASTVAGSWNSTDPKDTMAFVGYPKLTGTWASTETKDAFAASAFETPPLALDGYAEAGVNGPITSGTVTLTTTETNDVIVVEVVSGGYFNTSTVSSITDTAGLVWKKRNQRYRNETSHTPSIEIWWAHAPTALTGDVITVNFAASTGAAALIAFGVAGANYTAPWDTHTQAGGYTDLVGNNASFPAQAQLYTKASHAFLFGLHGDFSADAGLTESPWTYVTSAQGSEHDGYTPSGSFVYQVVDAPQSATNVPIGFSYGGGYVFSAQSVMFDSIVGLGETGTTDEIVWFWDASYVNGIISLTSTNELVLNYSAMNTNLMLLVQVLIQSASNTGEVTSIEESQNLLQSGYHFQRRSRVVEGNLATEIWWAWMSEGVANNDTITINTTNTASGDAISAQMWGLGGTTGSFGLGDPFWDGNPSVPATNQSATASPPPNTTDISTDTPSCMLVAWTANNTEQEPGYVDPYVSLTQDYPHTVLPIMQFNSSAPPAYMGFEYLYEPGLAANETAEFLVSPGPVGWMMIGDAIPVGPPQPPTGVLAVTDHKDSFTNDGAFDDIWTAAGWIGYVPAHAVWASTEHPDVNTNAGRWTALGWVTGWVGFLSLFTTWHSTENKDSAAFYAWLLGFGGITGQIAATENKDRLSFSNAATVTGKLQTTESKDRLSANAFLIPKARPAVAPRRRLLIVT